MKSNTIQDAIIACQSFREENCLYLEERANDAFFRAYRAASMHGSLLNIPVELRDAAGIQANWALINAAGPIIESCVALPPKYERPAEIPPNT